MNNLIRPSSLEELDIPERARLKIQRRIIAKAVDKVLSYLELSPEAEAEIRMALHDFQQRIDLQLK